MSTAQESLSYLEEREWLYYALPLPHQIKIEGKRVVAPSDIGIRVSSRAGEIENNAAKILRDFINSSTGVRPEGKLFEIVIGVLDYDGKVLGRAVNGAEKLKTLPNNDQAYIIEPLDGDGLVIAALDPKGAFYGAQTLRQLLKKGITREKIQIPLATVLDWPDFAVRGVWNSKTYLWYKWLSEVKLNYAKNYGNIEKLDRRGKPVFKKVNRELVTDAKNFAFNSAPIINHLNFLPRTCPLYQFYPDLAGKGEAAVQKTNIPYPCPCPSNPLLKTLLAEWLREYAKSGINDVSVWTSEFFCYCSCDQCAPKEPNKEQMVLEARSIAGAWREVQAEFPDFKARILGFPIEPKDYPRFIPDVMKEIPKDMIIEQVYPRYEFKDGEYSDAIDPYAAEGHKIVAYTLCHLNELYRSPAWIAPYAASLHQRGWYGTCSWISLTGNPSNFRTIGAHSLYAAAEWSWNANGRSLEDYFRAWATIEGLNHPENAAAWGKIISPLDLAMTDFRYRYATPKRLKELLDTIKARKGLIAALYSDALSHKNAFVDLEKALELAATLGREQAVLATEELRVLYRELSLFAELEAAYSHDPIKTGATARELTDVLKEHKKISAQWSAFYKKYRLRTELYHGDDFEGQIKMVETELLGK